MLNLYVAVGGLPDAVNAFLRTNNMNEVRKFYQSILKEYRDDMVKYAPDKDKPHIRECFNSVPKQLAKENKKFQYSKVKPGGRGETYAGSLQWLEDAGIICRCFFEIYFGDCEKSCIFSLSSCRRHGAITSS